MIEMTTKFLLQLYSNIFGCSSVKHFYQVRLKSTNVCVRILLFLRDIKLEDFYLLGHISPTMVVVVVLPDPFRGMGLLGLRGTPRRPNSRATP